MKRHLLTAFKFGISIAIIIGLVVLAHRSDPTTFERMLNQPKRWDQLALSFACVGIAVVLTFVRWYFLVRAVRLSFSMKDAFRLGFLGYFFNLFSLGSVGGDLFKAIFVAREQRERRAEAVATVVVDRIIGLYALFLVASLAALSSGLYHSPIREVQVVCEVAFVGTGVGAVGLVMLIIPGVTSGTVSRSLSRLPKIGPTVGKLIGAIRMYRSNPGILFVTGVMSLAVHSILAVGIYFLARGLPGEHPGFGPHFVIVPMAMLAGALPLPAAGLGAFEAALDFLYRNLAGAAVVVPMGQGLLVALTYRLMTILIALVGACYYIAARREVDAMMHTAESTVENTTPADSDDGISPATGERRPAIPT